MRIDPRTGRHYPSPKWAQWREEAIQQVFRQRPSWQVITKSVALSAVYTPSDRRIRDIPALLDSIFHVLERANILENDSLVKELHWTERLPNKTQAGMELSIVFYEQVP